MDSISGSARAAAYKIQGRVPMRMRTNNSSTSGKMTL